MSYVVYCGSPVSTTQAVLDRLGLHNGQRIDQKQFHSVCAENLAETVHQLAYEKPGDHMDYLAQVELVRMQEDGYLERQEGRKVDHRILQKITDLLRSNAR